MNLKKMKFVLETYYLRRWKKNKNILQSELLWETQYSPGRKI